MIDEGPKWAHSDLASPTNPQTALFHPLDIFSLPVPRSEFISKSLHGYPRMPTVLCTRHDRHRSNFCSRQVPFTPSPVGIGATSTVDSFNSDNYDHIYL